MTGLIVLAVAVPVGMIVLAVIWVLCIVAAGLDRMEDN